jgi:hypothetical protein
MYRVTFNGTIVSILKDGACASWEEVERLLNRRGPEHVPEGFVRTVPDPQMRTICTAEATGQLAERPSSGEMVMGLRVVVNPNVPVDEVWITNAHGKRLGTIVNLAAAEAEGRKG